MKDIADLTRNQSLVLEKLTQNDQPMSAYTLLDELRGDGFKAPLQVYRALDKLVAQGRVHRLDSISAFVACQHPECEGVEHSRQGRRLHCRKNVNRAARRLRKVLR
jgi:Fur family transcriptional regulator, zinc uptake regulator